MAKILCVLYDDPIDGMPVSYSRDAANWIATRRATLPTQARSIFPLRRLGCVSASRLLDFPESAPQLV